MKAIKILILAVAVFLALPSDVQAQKDSFTYLKTAVNEREPIPWPNLREGDVKIFKTDYPRYGYPRENELLPALAKESIQQTNV